ncbi:MAG: hypothetical protein IK066_01365, partial [Kiritimatiellae bacterium]|nr:hypothetical protein [Kiritimatiellia bacterium]
MNSEFSPSPLASLRAALPGLFVARRRHSDGAPFLAVSNPHPGGEPVRIDLDGEPALHFGPHHDHYDPTPDGWRALLGDARRIVGGTLVVCSFSDADASWQWHAFVDTGEPWAAPDSPPAAHAAFSPLRTEADAFRVLVDSQWNPMVGELFARFARVGAVLDVRAWDPAQNRRISLAPDWFQTIVRPTALDYLLAAVEVQSTPGGSLLESFSFNADDATYEALLDGSRWILRPAPWTCPPRQRRPIASAPTLDALLDL